MKRDVWFSYSVEQIPFLFKTLIDISEGAFLSDQLSLKEKYQSIKKKSVNDPLFDQITKIFEDYEKRIATTDIPRLFRQSVFLTIYSFFENILIDVCEHLYKNELVKKREIESFSSFKNKEKDGSYIDCAKKYIKQVLNRNFPDQTNEWKNIKDFERLRHVFIHRFGCVKQAGDSTHTKELCKLRAYIKATNELFIDQGDIVYIHTGYLPTVLSDVQNFLKKLNISLENEIGNDWEERLYDQNN